MQGLQISSEEVLQYANQLQNNSQEIQGIFHDVSLKMSNMEQVWSSPASSALIGQFHSLEPTFQSYIQALQEYAKFLKNTASLYQENEQSLSKGIQ